MRTKCSASSNETRLSAVGAHICARPTRAGLYYYRLNPLLSLGPGAEASIPRRRLRATPDPPFPTRAFSQRIGSKPAGATRRDATAPSTNLPSRPFSFAPKSSRFPANISPTRRRLTPAPIPFLSFLSSFLTHRFPTRHVLSLYRAFQSSASVASQLRPAFFFFFFLHSRKRCRGWFDCR